MPTSDCRVDYIKEYAFIKDSSAKVDEKFNLDKIKFYSSLHVTSLNPHLFSVIVEKCQLIKSLQFDSILGNLNDVWPLEGHSRNNLGVKPLTGLRVLICPSNVDELNLSFLLANCPNLESLIICFAEDKHANHGITGLCFKYLGVNIKHLILGNLVIKRETFNHLINSNGRLTQEIEILYPLSETPFNRVLELSNLRKLAFKACYCTHEQILNISKLVNLESLQVERLDFINFTLEDLFFSVFEKCRKLKQFIVSGVFKLYSYRLFEMIEENNLQLTHLHIQPNMYKSLIETITISHEISSLSSLRQLRSLALPYTNLTDASLQSLLTTCSQLTTIDLSYCKSIRSANFIATRARLNPGLNYSIYLQSTGINLLPELPENLKLCICNPARCNGLSLIPRPSYDLI